MTDGPETIGSGKPEQSPEEKLWQEMGPEIEASQTQLFTKLKGFITSFPEEEQPVKIHFDLSETAKEIHRLPASEDYELEFEMNEPDEEKGLPRYERLILNDKSEGYVKSRGTIFLASDPRFFAYQTVAEHYGYGSVRYKGIYMAPDPAVDSRFDRQDNEITEDDLSNLALALKAMEAALDSPETTIETRRHRTFRSRKTK